MKVSTQLTHAPVLRGTISEADLTEALRRLVHFPAEASVRLYVYGRGGTEVDIDTDEPLRFVVSWTATGTLTPEREIPFTPPPMVAIPEASTASPE